jgi:hypothetical protein
VEKGMSKALGLIASINGLHHRGVVNEDELGHVCDELLGADVPLTLDHLVRIFGVGPIYHLLTLHDETARQLVREARDILMNPETQVNIRDWVKSAELVVGPVKAIQREAVQD